MQIRHIRYNYKKINWSVNFRFFKLIYNIYNTKIINIIKTTSQSLYSINYIIKVIVLKTIANDLYEYKVLFKIWIL